jgi:L-seryl-tRNA(Ser) seleniumtransferase
MLWRYTRPLAEIQNLAQRLAEALAPILAGLATVQVIESTAQIGSGSLPIDRLPSAAVVIQPRGLSTQKMAKHFRQSGVIGRIQDDQLWLDLRAVRKEELSLTINAAKELVVCLDRNT